jgi:excisionase family DNA binding protein
MTTSALTVRGTAALTIPEAARELRVSRSTVYRLIAAGKLRTTSVATKGIRLRVEPGDIAELLANGRLPR